MKNFTVATWNVNSLRVRLPQVLAWLTEHQPDLLALQELKLPTEEFPYEAIQQAGYHAAVNGQKTYNGVAILSKLPLGDVVTDMSGLDDHQRRIVAATVEDIRIINLYVPNGESVTSEKYQYKLNWLNALKNFLKAELKQHSKIVMVGDFNIAPEECDVYDPTAWAGQVLFSEPERAEFRALLALGFKDCFRLHAQPEKSFSWWDYRVNAFKRNMGLRIDHILVNEALAEHCQECNIDKTPRANERPSDHAPVWARFI